MAQHHQLPPLKSLGGGGEGEGPAGVGDAAMATMNNFVADGESELLPNNDSHEHTHGHTNSFHHHHAAYPHSLPSPYPGQQQNQDGHCFMMTSGSNAPSTAPPLSGSLPPITSLGTRNSKQPFGASPVGPQPLNTSSSSATSALYNHNNQDGLAGQPMQRHPFAVAGTSNASSPVSPTFPPNASNARPYGARYGNSHNREPSPQQFRQQIVAGAGTFGSTGMAASSPMVENHQYYQQPQQPHTNYQQQAMASPAYSIHGMNNNNGAGISSSNPGSIISAPPESPLSSQSSLVNNSGAGPALNRSPSVRSNHSLQRMLGNSSSASTPPEPQQQSQQYFVNHNFGNGTQKPSEEKIEQIQLDQLAHQSPYQNSFGAVVGGAREGGELQASLTSEQSTAAGRTKRTYASSSRAGRIKTPTSMLPLLQQPFELTNPTGGGGSMTDNLMADGPTVRQHLQQQQVARRQKQQHEAMVRRLCQQQPQPRQEETIAWGGGEGQPIVDKPQMSPRKRPQIESAPPSVISGQHGGPSPCPFPIPNSGPSSSASCSADPQQQQQPFVGPSVSHPQHPPPHYHQQINKAESLSPPKRGARSARNKAAKLKTATTNDGAQPPTATPGTPGSSADTLASTIASVASGGGTFEFEKTLGTSPIPSTAGVAGVSETQSVAFPSTSQHQQAVATPSPGATKRKRAYNHQQQLQATHPTNAIVSALTQPQRLPPQSTSQSAHQLSQPQQLNMGQQEPMMTPSQCRIHVQNPPQTHGDFPPTGTKIQVVHMQPGSQHHHQQTMMAPLNMSPQPPGSSRSGSMAAPPVPRPSAGPRSIGSEHSASFDYPIGANTPQNGSEMPTTGSADLALGASPRSMPRGPPTPYSPYLHSQQPQQYLQQQQQQSQFPQTPSSIPFTPPAQSPQQQQGDGYGMTTMMQPPPTPCGPQNYGHQTSTSLRPPQSPYHHAHPSPGNIAADPGNRYHHYSQQQMGMQGNQNSPSHGRYQQQFHMDHQQQQRALLQHQQQSSMAPPCTPPSSSMGAAYPTHIAHQFPPTPQLVQQQQQSFHQQQRYLHQQQRQQQINSPMPAANPSPMAQQHHQQHCVAQQASHHYPMAPSAVAAALASPLPPASIGREPFPCPPSVAPPPMVSPLPQRAQLTRAQLITRNSKDMETRKYAVKLYHLQRTVKALVYKNGALADELARLNQRIGTVTDERRVLAKRLQHHERNRIRRIQSQYRKAIAAEKAKETNASFVKKEEEQLMDEEEKGGEGKMDSSGSREQERPVSAVSGPDIPSSTTAMAMEMLGQEEEDEEQQEDGCVKMEEGGPRLNGPDVAQKGEEEKERHQQIGLMIAPLVHQTIHVKDEELQLGSSPLKPSHHHHQQQHRMFPIVGVGMSGTRSDGEREQQNEISSSTTATSSGEQPHQQQQKPQLQMTLRPRATSSTSQHHNQQQHDTSLSPTIVSPEERALQQNKQSIGKQHLTRNRMNQPQQNSAMELRSRRSRSTDQQQQQQQQPQGKARNSDSPKTSSTAAGGNKTSVEATPAGRRPYSRTSRHSYVPTTSSAATALNHVKRPAASHYFPPHKCSSGNKSECGEAVSCSSHESDQHQPTMRHSTRRHTTNYHQQQQNLDQLVGCEGDGGGKDSQRVGS